MLFLIFILILYNFIILYKFMKCYNKEINFKDLIKLLLNNIIKLNLIYYYLNNIIQKIKDLSKLHIQYFHYFLYFILLKYF